MKSAYHNSAYLCSFITDNTEKRSRAIIRPYNCRLPLQSDTALKACTDYRTGGT